MRQLRVYGWSGWWHDPRNTNHHHQARFIMAAHSMAEIKRVCGVKQLWNICETGNSVEVPLAGAEPLALFVSPLDAWKLENYHKVLPTDEGVGV